uniref:Uncharacterized protein n=1 Tax=Megaselia scalaris TaxID=36166 RepID=T1GXW0_MEGSC
MNSSNCRNGSQCSEQFYSFYVCFPRKRYNNIFIANGPPESIGIDDKCRVLNKHTIHRVLL